MRTRAFVLFPLVLAAAVALAACGSSAKSPNARADLGLEVARCMRSHGVPNFPDPGSNGTLEIGPASGINPLSPAFQAARQACKQYFPNKGAPPAMSGSQRQAAFRFAQCMRRNGEPNFPDPGFKAPAGVTRELMLPGGMVFPIGAGIDPTSLAFRQAAARCGVTPSRGSPPGGAST